MRFKIRCCTITFWRWYDIKVGFIGPGKVGVNLGRYFIYKGIEVSGFYGRTLLHTKEASEYTATTCFKNIQAIINDSDILFITTPDDAISTIDVELSQFNLKNKFVCHTSGSLPSTALSSAQKSGAIIYSIHPIYAFSNKNIHLQQLEQINFSLEGDFLSTQKPNEEQNLILLLMKKIGNPFFIRKKEDGVTYHLANVFVSNLVLSLLEIGISYLKTMNISEQQAIKAMLPLIEGNIKNIEEKGFLNSLTGPVARGDLQTIQRHLSVVRKEDETLYRILSLHLLELVQRKGLQEDAYSFEEIESCLKGWKE